MSRSRTTRAHQRQEQTGRATPATTAPPWVAPHLDRVQVDLESAVSVSRDIYEKILFPAAVPAIPGLLGTFFAVG